jgi:SAM-dependent methyltransferase
MKNVVHGHLTISKNLRRVARVVLQRCGLTGIVNIRRKLQKDSGLSVAQYSAASTADSFDFIYRTAAWRLDNGQSLSGPGSDLQSTEDLRDILPTVLNGLGVRVLLDAGCGDFNWMKTVELSCHYIGADIVSSVIQANQAAYGNANRSFVCADIVRDPLPTVDAVICRELLFHLSYEQCFRALENLVKTGARYYFLTSNRGYWLNFDIATGDWRELNLEAAPFRLPAPRLAIRDDFQVPDRFLGVWGRAELHAALEGRSSRARSITG